MTIIDSIQQIKDRLITYRQSEVYKSNNYPKDIVCAIEIAANILEIADRNASNIRKEDKIWYQGVYQISRNFDDPQWSDIGTLYEKLVVEAEIFFE